MQNIDLSILSTFEIKNLEVLKKYGSRASCTDLVRVIIGDDKYDKFRIAEDRDLTGRSIYYYTKTINAVSKGAILINPSGGIDQSGTRLRNIGIRPVINFSDVPDYILNDQTNGYNETKEVQFLEYPQMAVSKDMQEKLNYLFFEDKLNETGKYYTLDANSIDSYDSEFVPFKFTEFEYENKKYIRTLVYGDKATLSNSVTYNKMNTLWIKVEPISWLVDEKSKLLISKKCLIAGIRFNDKKYDGDFSKTELKKYLDTYMSREMIPSKPFIKSTLKTSNPYNFALNSVSEEEIISGSIESDIPVFLHGPSSEGKSARVLEIDKDATIIYLANESPDTINGKSVYNEKNNEMIDIKPSWLVKLEEKCKDGKLHILFFDEITNAFPRVQGIVFNIILNKEVNGKWKLPDNARIVAAGNEMEDSLSANELSEPLFNRFAHVYIKTTTESWLKWASTHNIHPAIYSFIAYKNGSILRSKYDGKKVNADPRKWEMSSKMLYKTNNPAMLRSLVGEDITKEFLAFCSSRVITLEDVLNCNYTNEDIESLNTAERYATIMGLSMVNAENVKKVRKFVKNLNPELLKVFDNLWGNTEERLEILSEIELEKELIK